MSKARDLADGESRFVNASGDTMTGALNSSSHAIFTTNSAAGRGVGIANNVGDTSGAILQFTNNAVTTQLGYVAADASVIDINNTNAGTFRVQNDGNLWRLWGGVWRPLPFAMAAGTVSISLSGTSIGSTSVTFPSGRFTQAPIISIAMASAAGGSQKFVPRFTNISTTGATAFIYTGDSTTSTANVTIHWTAVQITSGSSVG
jgi:hypothetical protein